jgi:hypothetical protein
LKKYKSFLSEMWNEDKFMTVSFLNVVIVCVLLEIFIIVDFINASI